MSSQQYVVAINRNMKAAAPADWRETIAAVPGVQIVGDASLPALTIVAGEDAIARIRYSLGDYVYIEPIVDHYPNS